jgi:hypothetical protein
MVAANRIGGILRHSTTSRTLVGLFSFIALLSSACDTCSAAERVFYEDLQAASDSCSPTRVESEVGHQTFVTIRTLAFAKIIGAELDKAKEALSKVADIVKTQMSGKPQLLVYLSCVSQKLSTNNSNPFETSHFFGLNFKSDPTSLSKIGVSLTSEKMNDTFGPYVMVDKIRGEPSNTLERQLFYKVGYGLYRAVLRLGSRGGNQLSPDEAYLRMFDMTVKLNLVGAKVIKSQPFETFDKYSVDDIRACPKGSPELRATLAKAAPEELKQFLIEGKENTVKESQLFAIFCDMMPEPRLEFAFEEWGDSQEVILAVIATSPKQATVNVVLVDRNIAEFVVNERKSK